MKIRVVRKLEWTTDEASIGELFLNDATVRFCYTLEDVPREEKIAGETCIPPGIYKAIVSLSQRFKRRLLLLLDVPDFDSIRVHGGNSKEDTHGCILVGFTRGTDRIGKSQLALMALMLEVEKAVAAGEDITVEVVEG